MHLEMGGIRRKGDAEPRRGGDTKHVSGSFWLFGPSVAGVFNAAIAMAAAGLYNIRNLNIGAR